jgi:hypothetical protein
VTTHTEELVFAKEFISTLGRFETYIVTKTGMTAGDSLIAKMPTSGIKYNYRWVITIPAVSDTIAVALLDESLTVEFHSFSYTGKNYLSSAFDGFPVEAAPGVKATTTAATAITVLALVQRP